MTKEPVLWHIGISHYSEKARWALDRCDLPYTEEGHLPLFHWLPARRAGGGRTVPILVDGKTVLADSTGIVEWADDRKEGALYPDNPADKADALKATLNAVSAKLDTTSLADMVKQVVVDKKDASEVAKTWLASSGLA